MVIFKEYPLKWKCPYCGDKFEDEDDANDCARDCVDVDPAEEVDGGDTECICEYCNTSYMNGISAEECEAKHIEKEDRLFEEFNRKESMARLQEAAEHPQQIKLNTF